MKERAAAATRARAPELNRDMRYAGRNRERARCRKLTQTVQAATPIPRRSRRTLRALRADSPGWVDGSFGPRDGRRAAQRDDVILATGLLARPRATKQEAVACRAGGARAGHRRRYRHLLG